MKRLLVSVLVILILCGCGKKDIPPDFSMASQIYHCVDTEFDPDDYCRIKSYSGGNVEVTYEGEVDINTVGDYKITVTADDEFGGEVSKDVTVTVRENRSAIDNKTVCKNLNEYIKGLIKGGKSNIGNLEKADGFGRMASAYSVNGRYRMDDSEGNLLFECYHLEKERYSVMNAIFWVEEKAMWYVPQKLSFTAGETKLEFAVSEGISEDGKYGCYAVLNEFGENIREKHPDYVMIEKIRKIAEYKGDVVMEAIGTSGSYKLRIAEGHKKDFKDILGIYEEMLSYYK